MTCEQTENPIRPARIRRTLQFLGRRAREAVACGMAIPRYGRPPRTLLFHGGGPGDAMLCTAVLKEMHNRNMQRVWIMSHHSSIFDGCLDAERCIPFDYRVLWLYRRLGSNVVIPDYAPGHNSANDRDGPPERHIISVMCRLAGLRGRIAVRPYIRLCEREREYGESTAGSVVIQSAGLDCATPMQNKQWYPDRFQEVVSRLQSSCKFIQLGSRSDPPLEGALDMRGKTTLRESAAVIASAKLFVGSVGFLMHLARAVECRSVIVYGGRELPTQSGYTCNENIATAIPCAPCWLRNKCPYDRECMRRITPDMVVDAVHRQLARTGELLAVDYDEL